MIFDFFLFSIIIATCSRILFSFFTEYLNTIKLKSSTNKRQVIFKQDFITFSNTLLIYTKKSIENIGDPCEILVLIFCS